MTLLGRKQQQEVHSNSHAGGDKDGCLDETYNCSRHRHVRQFNGGSAFIGELIASRSSSNGCKLSNLVKLRLLSFFPEVLLPPEGADVGYITYEMRMNKYFCHKREGGGGRDDDAARTSCLSSSLRMRGTSTPTCMHARSNMHCVVHTAWNDRII